MSEYTLEKAMEIVKNVGFSVVEKLDVSTLSLLDEVRDMCSTNQCGMYGKNWACPPACGSLEECRKEVAEYTEGILVQTIGEIEDSYDFEAMMEIQDEHKEKFLEATALLKGDGAKILPLGAGCCTQCKKCAYPDEPCRFPQKCVSSMEAYGLLVNDICKKNNVPYYYGSTKMAYTACYLLK